MLEQVGMDIGISGRKPLGPGPGISIASTPENSKDQGPLTSIDALVPQNNLINFEQIEHRELGS